ncbi:ATP synthase F1 subunit delta [Gemmatimonadota bacterium DH-20]|uniref:ATP synthase subunit delta n=1 Tax=Gaopeijia maritima TaxID=3119007 RepID=A0ABU9EDL0_9BACT
MRDQTVARNYAEALFDLARRHEGLEAFGEGIAMVASLVDDDPRLRQFLETPRIDAEAKKSALRKALGGRVPPMLVNFLLVVIDKRRQRLIGTIATEFAALVDEHENRAHVEVTVAQPLNDATSAALTERLSRLLGKTAVPHVRVDPSIIGGVVVRAGDTIYDGSLRRRLSRMRRQLMTASLSGGNEQPSQG